MTYELPRTESGEVDYYELKQIIQENGIDDDLLMAIVNNARAEEREACAKFIDHKVMGYGDEFAKAIRARGESE